MTWAAIGLACLVGLVWERYWWWRDRKLAKIAACPGHRWIWHSLHDAGEYWNKSCERCPAYETQPGKPHVGDRIRVGKDITRLR